MSHESVIIAISPEQLSDCSGNLEAAVVFQMEPFNENSEWFQIGRRWDGWSIGGRYTGKFTPDYDPESDLLNIETCSYCHGSGTRDEKIVQQERIRCPPYTCNACSGKGQRLKDDLHWRSVGNVCKRGDLNESHLAKLQGVAAKRLWDKWLAESRKVDFKSYGLVDGETLETITAKYKSRPLTADAFVKDCCWHECGRLDWRDESLLAECEQRAQGSGFVHPGQGCHSVYTCKKSGARLIGFDDERNDCWDCLYWPRFIRNLPEDTTLVGVDCHF
jgi:hypothetical protein